MWEQLNQVLPARRQQSAAILNTAVARVLCSVQEGGCLFQGITDSTMSHGEGWQYIQLADLWNASTPSLPW